MKPYPVRLLGPQFCRELLRWAGILLACYASFASGQEQVPISCKGPLTEEQVTRLLKSGVADVRVQAFVGQCSVNFELTPDVEYRLRGAGASDALLRLARSAWLNARKEEIRLSELRRTLSVKPLGARELNPNLTLDEARQQLVLLRAQKHDIETRLKTQYPNLQASSKITKDTFETTAEYEARQAKATAEHEQVEQAYNKDLAALTEIHNNQIVDLLSRQYRQPRLKVTLTKYDADKQLLFAAFGNFNCRFQVESARAKVFYTHQNSLEVKAQFLKMDDARGSAVFEITLLDPQTRDELKSGGVGLAPYYAAGFTTVGLSLNGDARLVGSRLRLTDAARASEAASAFWDIRVEIQMFETDFDFQLPSADASGFTFVIQNAGTTALGVAGSGLGYEFLQADSTHGDSVAVMFQFTHSQSTTGLLKNGQSPKSHSQEANGPLMITPSVNLRDGHVYSVHMDYDGKTLSMTITDAEKPTVTFSTSWTVDIPNIVGSKTAYVGFTGGTGSEIIKWSYTPGLP